MTPSSDVLWHARLRNATAQDTTLLLRAWAADAQAGHFSPMPVAEAQQFWTSVVEDHRHPLTQLPAYAFVFEEEGQPVGCSMLTLFPTQPKALPGPMQELWWVHILPEHRGRGLGGRLLDAILAQIQPPFTLVARTQAASTQIRQMLGRRGFAAVYEDKGGVGLYRGTADHTVLVRRHFEDAIMMRDRSR